MSINAVATKSIKLVDGFLAFSIIVSTLPILYISFVALKWIFTRENVQKKLNKYLQCYKRSIRSFKEMTLLSMKLTSEMCQRMHRKPYVQCHNNNHTARQLDH